MNPTTLTTAVLSIFTSALCAQNNPSLLYTTILQEQTLSGSGGTVLQTLRPNEVVQIDLFPCPSFSAEKWSPRTCYDTMAGDDNADGVIFNAGRFGAIDALLDMPSSTPVGTPNHRTIFWSPSVAMGTNISGGPGLRPGDTGRITYNTSGFGLVEHFLTVEDLQIALGLPPTPVILDIDAIAADPSMGVYFSLNNNLPVTTTCGVTFVQDGDVLVIPASAITWTTDFRVAATVPGSAEMVYTEAMMDAFVVAANVANNVGACVTQVVDVEGLEFDLQIPVNFVPGCTGLVVARPTLIFTARSLRGCSVLTTNGGGQIWGPSCGPLGTSCGSGATLGNQVGLLPAAAPVGIPSFMNAIALTRTTPYTLEPQQHLVPLGFPAIIDVNSPGAVNFVFGAISPPTVAPCAPFPNLLFPDVYVLAWVWSTFTPGGFSTFATPPVNIPAKVVFQAGTFVGPNLVLSTPATVEW